MTSVDPLRNSMLAVFAETEGTLGIGASQGHRQWHFLGMGQFLCCEQLGELLITYFQKAV